MIVTKILIKILLIICILINLPLDRVYANSIENIRINWLKSQPIAHRGLFNDKYPENSLSAFENAINNGYAIELDVRLTKDKQVIVFHDKNLKRLTGNPRDVKDTNYYEIEEMKLQTIREKIPLFEDVLKMINGRVPILVEIKNDYDLITLEKEVYNKLKLYNGLYAIQSYNTKVIEWYAKNVPNVPRGLLIGSLRNKKNLSTYTKFILNNKEKFDFISTNLSGIGDLRIQELRKSGTIIIVATIKNEKEKNKSKKYADNFIFNNFIPKK